MFTPVECIPAEELLSRHARCRELLARHIPAADGILITGTPNVYYMTGTTANGLAWLPLEGDMVLAVRKGLERAKLESPLAAIVPFRSYKELSRLCAEAGSPLAQTLAVDQAGVSWEQGRLLHERLSGRSLVPGDVVIARTRARKTPWELGKMRESCRCINVGFRQLAERIHPGMSEYAIARILSDIYFTMGHTDAFPTGIHGSMVTLGHICAGNNGNYPSAYDGPLGVMGVHPASPSMGNAHSIWREGDILTVDSGFNFEGYLSDKTQTFFAGKKPAVPAAVRKAQDTALRIARETAAALKPGAIPAEIYALSLDIATQAGYGDTYMGHGDNQVRFLGHGIGLTVSEWPIFARGFGEPLQPGMTLALEPKIALPGIGMVGVENTYEITETGAACLTGDITDILCLE